jgi:hypothetical protein
MVRFVLFVLGGSIAAGILWSMAPIAVAYGINWLVPFGFERYLGTPTLQHYLFASAAVVFPLATLSVVRTGRRMHFGDMDGRPALLGCAGSDPRAAQIYGTRMRSALVVSVLALLVAISSAKFFVPSPAFPVTIACACLLFVVAGICAIEFNDLRRTANLGGLHSDA